MYDVSPALIMATITNSSESGSDYVLDYLPQELVREACTSKIEVPRDVRNSKGS